MESIDANFVGVTGLPRAGSTLLCQLLAQHPEIACEGHSSPLCNMLLGIRRMVSDDQFFLAQLDQHFDESYVHLAGAMRGFLRGWQPAEGKKVVVDKNRAWLHAIEMLLHIEPEARLIVCLRELGQIYGSIEAQHQGTILIDFIDHIADFDRFGRANVLFAKEKAIGAPLSSVQAVDDLPAHVKQRLYFLRFEDLIDKPVQCMSHIYAWLGLSPHETDPDRMPVGPHESDSHYRMKFPHKRSSGVAKPRRHDVPPRIQKQIEEACAWYYQRFYP
jgi:sulfotransferase